MALPRDLVEEVLLRFPPADPATLVRAALVSTEWHRILAAPRFRRRFLELHRAPPVLGLLCNLRDGAGYHACRLVSTNPAFPPHADQANLRALDARHGRVLLGGTGPRGDSEEAGRHLAVWDPVTYGLRELPPVLADCNAALLCGAAGDDASACDHLDCHGGPFVVVSLGTGHEAMWLCVYSSDDDSWSEPTYVHPTPEYGVAREPTALVGNTRYFAIDAGRSILRYGLETREASVIDLPESSCLYANVLMTMEDGGLGVARAERDARLSLWSMEASPNGGIGWTKIRVVEPEKLFPVDALPISCNFVGFAHGVGVFFIGTDAGLFSIDLKSGKVGMVCEGNGFHGVVPYMSFYTPALVTDHELVLQVHKIKKLKLLMEAFKINKKRATCGGLHSVVWFQWVANVNRS